MDATPLVAHRPAPLTGPTQFEQMRSKAVELEGVFLNTLVSQMFAGLDTEGAFGGGFAEKTWRSLQTEQYASQLAEGGGIGLADQIVSEMLRMQEQNSYAPANGVYPR
jgi:Rod binding domain-containing protein